MFVFCCKVFLKISYKTLVVEILFLSLLGGYVTAAGLENEPAKGKTGKLQEREN